MTQQTDIRMNGEEEEKTDKIKKNRRKSGSKTDVKKTSLHKADDTNKPPENEIQKHGESFGESSPAPAMEANIPLVRIHQATPSPRPPDQPEDVNEKKKKKSKRRKKKDEGEEGVNEEDESDENGEEEEEEEDVEEEEEEEDSEMTQEEKKAMYEAVIEGDIDVLEDCLDLPNSDINMIWFQENLLMAAIRAGHVDVAEFLLDNGVDSTFSTSVVDVQETPNGKIMERYEVDCRQMAYDRDLQEVVFLIDLLQDNLFPFIPRPVRTPRLRRPKPESSDDGDTEDDDADDESQAGNSDVTDSSSNLARKEEEGIDTPGSEGSQQIKKKKKKKREKLKKQSRVNSAAEDDGVQENNTDVDDDDDGRRTATVDEEDGDKDKTFRTGSTSGDVDSGNYSMANSKLKKSLLHKHDKLLENEERSMNSADSPRKSESESTRTKSPSQKTKGDKTERTSTTFTQDEGQSSSGPIESKTTSQEMVPEIPQWAAVLNPPTNRIRSTKAVVAAKQGNLSRSFYKSPLHASTTERPLKWRKVSTNGSYARESRRWHLENKIEEANIEKVSNSHLSITPLFPPSSSTSNSIPSSTTSFSSKSLKSQRLSTTPSDISESISIASLSIQDRVDRFMSPKSIPKRSSPLQTSASEVASYMRPTQSTITKQRLGTQFVDSYSGLGFCPNPSKSTNFHMGIMKSQGRLQINTTGVLSRSQRVPVLTPKSIVQRRNENVISYRT